jgi:tetratricopeptide (TPR) repeat protein
MNKKVNHIFTASHCPDETELVEYVKGRMNAGQMHKIEVHLADCEMCSDFVEGLSLMTDPDRFINIVSELNKNIDVITAKKSPVRFFNLRIMSGIAALLIILVVATFILQKQFAKQAGQEVAENVNFRRNNSFSTYFDNEESFAPIDQGKKISAEKTGKKAPPLISDIEYIEQDFAEEEYRPVSTTGSAIKDIMFYNIIAEQTDHDDVEIHDVTADETLALVMEEKNMEDTRSKSGDYTEAETISLSRGTSKESRKTEAGNVNNQITSGVSETNEGINLYNAKNYLASLLYFENILKSNPHDHEAQWYYALSLIKLQRTEEAIKVLQAIVSAGGKYKKQAEKELRLLQE